MLGRGTAIIGTTNCRCHCIPATAGHSSVPTSFIDRNCDLQQSIIYTITPAGLDIRPRLPSWWKLRCATNGGVFWAAHSVLKAGPWLSCWWNLRCATNGRIFHFLHEIWRQAPNLLVPGILDVQQKKVYRPTCATDLGRSQRLLLMELRYATNQNDCFEMTMKPEGRS